MKTSSAVLVAVLALAIYSLLYFGLTGSESDPSIPSISTLILPQDSSSGFDEMRTKSSIGEVVFPHLEHIEDFEIECQECHHEVNATALEMPHSQYFEDFWVACSTCHKDDSEPPVGVLACSDCHHERPDGVADRTLSSKVVMHKNCWDCHEIGTGAEASGECSLCHSGEKSPYSPIVGNQ